MFDPAKADPFVLRVLQNTPGQLVQVVGEALRRLNSGEVAGCLDLLRSARARIDPKHPGQKVLSSLQVGIEAVRALKPIDPTADYARIWNQPEDGAKAQELEISVSKQTQAAVVDEIRRQLATMTQGEATCPCCGAILPEPNATAPLLMLDQELGHIRLYVDLEKIRAVLARESQNADIGLPTVIPLASMIARSAGLTVPVSTCGTCGTAVQASTFDPDRVAAFYIRDPESADGAAAPRAQGRTERFVHLYGRALFPLWLLAKLGIGAGTRVLDFGCGQGTMLKHLSLFGAEVHGFDLDRERVAYARAVLGLDGVTHSLDDYLALEARGFDVVVSSHTLEHVTGLDRHVRRLCDLVKPGGHLAIAMPNGELTRRGADGGTVFPMLGGDHLIAMTPDGLARRVTDAGLEVVEVWRGPANVMDRNFDPTLRDRLTGSVVWSEAAGDFVVLARRPV